jgi:hypothetical protein
MPCGGFGIRALLHVFAVWRQLAAPVSSSSVVIFFTDFCMVSCVVMKSGNYLLQAPCQHININKNKYLVSLFAAKLSPEPDALQKLRSKSLFLFDFFVSRRRRQ